MTNNKSKITNVIKAISLKPPEVMFRLDEPMKDHTSFKIGGAVRVMFFPGNAASLIEICDLLNDHEVSPLIIGNGSNLLVCDDDLDIAVINTSSINSISIVNSFTAGSLKYCDIAVDAGTMLSKAAEYAYKNGLTGLEFAHGIPGTLGGTIVMNAGAYGTEMKDIVSSTTAYNNKAGKFTLTGEENDFSYRRSRFTDSEDVVLSAVLRLSCGDKKSIKQKMDELGVRRKDSQPLDLPSGGSTFKRPKEGYAAALIEQAGLRGFSIGDAQVSEKHTGFIINKGNAKFNDVIALIEHIQKVVLSKNGIKLEPEIRIIKA